MKKQTFLAIASICLCGYLSTAQTEKSTIDSLYIFEVEDKRNPDKVLHAEPLYIDLIRDLGARKGEKEWNFGTGLTDNLSFDSYEVLVEYEFAPINRLGLEIEMPFTFYSANGATKADSVPSDKVNGLKLAAQWSFFVNEKIATSMALGYLNEFLFTEIENFGNPLINGNMYNPFFVVAKRWGNNIHTLLYTGPQIFQDFTIPGNWHAEYKINANLHYMISGTRNFIGLEFNQTVQNGFYDMVIRPQMRLGIADNFLIGIVGGIPVNRSSERLSSFIRVIWEPGHKLQKRLP